MQTFYPVPIITATIAGPAITGLAFPGYLVADPATVAAEIIVETYFWWVTN